MAGITHTVRAGECLSTIAAQYGLPWKALWDAPENAALRRKRKDPNVLLVGDVLTVPRPKDKQVAVKPGQAHKFVLKRDKVKVYLRLTASLEGLGGEPYELEIEGQKIEGKTAGDGVIEAEVPPGLAEMTLTLPKRRQKYTLALGEIDPISTLRGGQTRLFNMGLYAGEQHGELDEATASALEFFQRAQKLPVTRKYDASTQRALAELYGF